MSQQSPEQPPADQPGPGTPQQHGPQHPGGGMYGQSYQAPGPQQGSQPPPSYPPYQQPPHQPTPPQYQPYGGGFQPAAQQPATPSEERTWGILANASIPIFAFIGPLIGYLMFKDRSAYLKQAATEALNFSITYSIASVALGIVGAVGSFGFGTALSWLLWVAAIVLCVLATISASKHEIYRYPVNIRFIK